MRCLPRGASSYDVAAAAAVPGSWLSLPLASATKLDASGILTVAGTTLTTLGGSTWGNPKTGALLLWDLTTLTGEAALISNDGAFAGAEVLLRWTGTGPGAASTALIAAGVLTTIDVAGGQTQADISTANTHFAGRLWDQAVVDQGRLLHGGGDTNFTTGSITTTASEIITSIIVEGGSERARLASVRQSTGAGAGQVGGSITDNFVLDAGRNVWVGVFMGRYNAADAVARSLAGVEVYARPRMRP